ncbi:PMT_2 domain-containing protein [Durusdinium trenchii]|uniref:PMT_2 domain-containing protein n=1 Tax=Durusdinium trenchii TaxID=1381693 RepID=A0ABP0NXT1_9DINO
MTVTHVGATNAYSENWGAVFGKSNKKSTKKTAPKKKTAKTSPKKKAAVKKTSKKKAVKKSAKKKTPAAAKKKPAAVSLAATLLGRFKQQIDSLELIPSSGGRFELLLDGHLEYSKLQTGLFVLLGVTLRIHDLGHSLWLDELHTAWVVDGPLSEVAPRARIGNHSPAFFYVEWGIMRAFGLSELALRSLSVAASTAVMIVAAWAVWRWTASSLATIATSGLLAVDRLFIFYAQDARPYALLELVALLQLISLREVLQKAQRGWRVALVATSVAMLYLHYASALLLLAEAVFVGVSWYVSRGRRPVNYHPRTAMIDVACVIGLAIPLVPHVLQVASQRGNWAEFVPRPALIDFVTLFPLDVWLLYPALVAGLVHWWKHEPLPRSPSNLSQHRSLIVFLLGVFLILLVMAWGLTRIDLARVFLKRYLMIAAVAPIMATAIIGALLRPPRVQVAYFVTLVVGLAVSPLQTSAHSVLRNVYLNHSISGHAREDWRAAAEYVRKNRNHAAPVFVRSGFIECTEENLAETKWIPYGTAPLNNLYALADDESHLIPLTTPRPWDLIPQARQLLMSAGEGWIVLRGNTALADKTAAELENSLSPIGTWRVARLQTFSGRPGVTVFHLEQVGITGPDTTTFEP